MIRYVTIKSAPISERMWNVGDEARVLNDKIRLGGNWFPFDDRYEYEEVIKWGFNEFTITTDEVKNNDKVFASSEGTDFGVWTFFDEGGGTAPMPFWANRKACKKIIKVNGKDIDKISDSKLNDLY